MSSLSKSALLYRVFYACAQRDDICKHNIILVCKTIVIEEGVWGSSPRKFKVIFIQNGAILGNTNGYISLNISHNKWVGCPF